MKIFSEIFESMVFEYGCIMINIELNKEFEIAQDLIDDEDLTEEDGKETNPHLTLLYGIESNVDEFEIFKWIQDFKPNFDLIANQISLFENENFDVVKYEIILNKELKILRAFTINEFPNKQTFPNYNPHITIAYTKKGKGKKYIKNNLNVKFKIKNVTYSRCDKTKIESKIYK